jgi:hypothetical protein
MPQTGHLSAGVILAGGASWAPARGQIAHISHKLMKISDR